MGNEYFIISGLIVLFVLIIWLIYEVISRKQWRRADEQIWSIIEKVSNVVNENMLKYIDEKDVDYSHKISMLGLYSVVKNYFDKIMTHKDDKDTEGKISLDKKTKNRWDYFGK